MGVAREARGCERRGVGAGGADNARARCGCGCGRVGYGRGMDVWGTSADTVRTWEACGRGAGAARAWRGRAGWRLASAMGRFRRVCRAGGTKCFT